MEKTEHDVRSVAEKHNSSGRRSGPTKSKILDVCVRAEILDFDFSLLLSALRFQYHMCVPGSQGSFPEEQQ